MSSSRKKSSFKLPQIPRYDGPFPFTDGNSSVYEPREKLRIFLMTITLIAPIRMLLIIILWITGLIYIRLVIAGHDYSKPIHPESIRGRLLQLLRYPCLLFLALSGFYRIGFLKCKGANPTHETRVFVSNHVSVFDGMFYWVLFQPSYLVREDILNIPIFGPVIKFGVQCVGINNKTIQGRKEAVNIINARVQDTSAPSLVIFPTAICSNQKIMTRWKPGAFLLGKPVQPLILNYKNKYGNLGYAPDVPMALIAYYACCQFVNYCDVVALPVYKPNKKEIENPKLFAENVRKYMANWSNAKLTNHQASDCFLYEYLRDNKLPLNKHFTIYDVSKKFGLHYSSFLKLAKSFKKFDLSRSGGLNESEFGKMFGVDDMKENYGGIIPKMVRKLFKMVDTNDDGLMNYEEFLVLIATMLAPKNKESFIKLMFNCLDVYDNGYIKRDDFVELLKLYSASSYYDKDKKYDDSLLDILFCHNDDDDNKENHKNGTIIKESIQQRIDFREFSDKLLIDKNYNLVRSINCYILRDIVGIAEFDKIESRVF